MEHDKCPDCEAPNKFPLRKRPHGDSATIIEIYIACTVCTFDQVLRLSTDRLEGLYKRRSILEASSINQIAKHGEVVFSTQRALRRIRHMIREDEYRVREHERAN